MTRKITGLIAAGFLAIGIVIGAAGTTAARDDAGPDMADHMRGVTSMMSMMGAGSMADMTSMMSMTGAGSMADMTSMMSMMGVDSPMTPNASMRPAASISPGGHTWHHASPSPEAIR